MKKSVKIILTLLIILNIAFIWGNSFIKGETSNSMSVSVVETADKVLGVERDEPVNGGTEAVRVARKAAHFIEFMCLGILLALRLQERKGMPLISLVLGASVATVDELIQKLGDRAPAAADVLLDVCGLCVGIIAVLGAFLLVKHLKKRQTSA